MINSIKYFEEKCISKFEQLEDDFMKEPTKLAEYVFGLTDELHKLGLEMIKESLEYMDMMLRESALRREKWVIETRSKKQLTTSLGDITFNKTFFCNKETGEGEYLLDRIMGLASHQRITEDAEAKMLEEAVQTSYRRGGEEASLTTDVSKQTVKNKIHQLEFPQMEEPEEKKKVDYLYIDADEDHVSLQFREKKGDLTENENHQKNNCLITKLVYVYEGVENESPKGKRHRLVNPYYFCGVHTGEENKKFWDEIYRYLDSHYDLEYVKKIYVNSDGGSWIKAGMKQIAGITHVLDEFHLEKYLTKLTSHMKDSREDAADELRTAIRSKTKKDFEEIVDRLEGCLNGDQKRIPISVAVEMSFFTRQIQQWIHEYCIDVHIPKWNELADLRSGVPQKDITKENLYEYLNGKKNVPDAPEKIVFTKRKLNQYFPKYMSTPERERIIISLLERWKEEQDNKRQ